jgi:hypothetical protein
MRIIMIFAHPLEDSFNAALHRTVVNALVKPALRSMTATCTPRASTPFGVPRNVATTTTQREIEPRSPATWSGCWRPRR